MKRAIVSVISDLVTDQRVDRTSSTLGEMGFAVTLVGRQMKKSPALEPRSYSTRRFRLWWEKGPIFYAAFNLRLFFYLLFQKADLLVANDLDTLLPNFLVSWLKRIPLLYDSHEYFTEVPELQGRRFAKRTWLAIERWIFPRLKKVMTVNDSIARLYREKYGVDVAVVRNVPVTLPPAVPISRSSLGIPEKNAVVIFQGSGINIHRGAEEALAAMEHLDGVTLLFAGGGDVVETLKQETTRKHLEHKVLFIPRQPPADLRKYTAMADIGLSLDKDTNINYRFSLPNKLFDYIHAGVPVLASPLHEVRQVVEGYDIGRVVSSHDPLELANTIRSMLADPVRLAVWKENLKIAARELCWENEKKNMIRLVHA